MANGSGIMISPMDSEEMLKRAVAEARAAVIGGEGGPFGAIVAKGEEILGAGRNTVIKDADPTAHAEMNAIREAARRLTSHDLKGCVLYATSEPCPMCLAAAYWAGIEEIIFCLPADIASQAGFADSEIYREFKLPKSKRRVKVSEAMEMRPEAVQLFREWRDRGGRLY
jgi:tRNA(Arg) A34 adenosine deaminase TadA